MNFYYRFIMPNISNLARGRKNIVMEEIDNQFNQFVAEQWENLSRQAVSGNRLFGHRWGEASRWWGTVPTGDKGKFREMEFDLIAESTDGKAILVGECKWTNPEIASETNRRLLEKASLLQQTQDKELITVLFLKNIPKDGGEGINIIYPQDVINAMYAD